MKKRIISIISSLIIVSMFYTSVYADNNYAENYEEIYSQDFSGFAEGSLDNSYYINSNKRISAQVENGQLKVNNDGVAYFAVNSAIDNVTVVKESSLNKHGIEMCYNTACYVVPLDTPSTYNGVEYAYKCTAGGNGAVYFAAVGGAGALLSKSIVKSEVVAYDDLGTEAIRRLEVKDFPVIVVIDCKGNDLYDSSIKEFCAL